MVEAAGFEEHLRSLQGTMFYVCKGSCLCGSVNNRGKVIYCYGDLVPRQGELFSDGDSEDSGVKTTPRDLLAAQLGIWVFGLVALLIVLLLIRKSISSLRQNIEKVTERLPWYHDDDEDDDILSNHSQSSPQLPQKDTTFESMVGVEGIPPVDILSIDENGTGPPPGMQTIPLNDDLNPSRPPWFGNSSATKPLPTDKLRKLRLKGKDYKKGGDGLRGKNVTEAYRVKEKDLKRTMKF